MKKMNLDSLLEKLCLCSGVSGEETEILDEIEKLLQPFCETKRDAFGNLIASQKGCMEEETELLLEAHVDRVGLIILECLSGGFLRAASCGGEDPRILPGSAVKIGEVTGVVCSKPPHLQGKDRSGAVPEKNFLIDTGLGDEELKTLVHPGDRAYIPADFTRLLGDHAACGAMDNRSGCAALILCAESLKDKALPKVKWAFCVQEETGFRGASPAAFALKPKKCICVDVSFGLQPFVPAERCAVLGQGPMIGCGVPMDREMTKELIDISCKNDIPYQHEIYSGSSGTDADSISISGEGVRCALLSIPLRNMHTPVEVLALSDVESTARLICAYIMEKEAEMR